MKNQIIEKQNKKAVKNVRRLYTQQVLSGLGGLFQSPDTDGNSSQNEQRGEEKLPPEFWKQKSYNLSFSVIIETVSSNSDQYEYKICINDDTDILITPTSKRVKKTPKQTFTIHQETSQKTRKVPMVYGIHKKGEHTLSYSTGYSIGKGVTEFYSWLLGQIDRTIEQIILQQENTAGNENSGQRIESTPTPTNVGTDKETGRSKKIRAKIRNENKPKNRSSVDEANGKILGRGPRDVSDKLVGVGNITHLGDES